MNQNGIDMQVCVEGRPVREFGAEGRTIVEGRKGVSFTIKVRNNHPTKVHVSVLVDGVGVVSGNEKDLRGYILEAYSSYEVKGWRKSLNDVASFVFETKDKSYTKAVKGSDAQCGVISLIAHAEKVKPQPPQIIEKHIHHDHHHYDEWYDTWPWPYRRPRPYYYPPGIYCTTTGAAGSSMTGEASAGVGGPSYSFSANLGGNMMRSAAGPKADGQLLSACNFVSQGAEAGETTITASMSVGGGEVSIMNLGTGWGATQQDSVAEVAWQDGVQLVVMELYYTDTKGLKKLGIDVSKAPATPKTSSFPTGLTGTGFCQPPTFEYAGEPVVPPVAATKPASKTKKKR